jgi:hypothetical protein
MLTDCNSLAIACASKTGPKPSPLDRIERFMERLQPTNGRSATPADINRKGRPTSIGTGGRHQSECPADIIGIRIQTVREKFTCRSCEKITQPPAPFHVIARARAGASLLAMILYAKFGVTVR